VPPFLRQTPFGKFCGVPVATTLQLSVADFLPKRLNQQRVGASTAAIRAVAGLRPEIAQQTHRPAVLDAARGVRKFGRYLPCSLAGLQRLNVRNGSQAV
jgi:hypothetical protein